MDHLASCPECRGEMNVADVGPFTRVACPTCGAEVRVKAEMGPYRLLRLIAHGGMSVIYAAHDTTLDREIAVKVLNEEYSADENREAAFKREARLTATVSHPNIVDVYTVGRAYGRNFIAMELVPGESLEERMSDFGALPEDAVVRLALQVVDGLRSAQTAGLLHRDIKPGNILIAQDGTAKLVDFGLSLLTESGIVQAEEIWATPTYVAPEVLEQSGEDHRADIYALGSTLYHALSGCRPIELTEVSNKAARKAKQEIVPLKRVAPWLSNETVQIVEKAMADDPDERFLDYENFRAELENARMALKEKGTKAPVQGRTRSKRRKRYDTRRKVLFGLSVLVVGGLLTATGLYLSAINSDEEKEGGVSYAALMVDPEKNPNVGLEAAMQINETYQTARKFLDEDDYVGAEQKFCEVWRNEQAPAETAIWAGFEAVVVSFLDGRSADARQYLADLFDFVNERQASDTVMGRRVQAAAELLTDLQFIPTERIPEVLDKPFRATVFFAMALKTWEQGDVERAGGMFEKFLRSGPWPESDWMQAYLRIGNRYVADYRLLSAVELGTEGKTRAEIEAGILALDKLHGSLKTIGRARFNVKAWQSVLRERLRYFRNRKVDEEWGMLCSEVSGKYFSDGKFAAGANALQTVELKGDLERSQRAALLFFAAEAEVFLGDLVRVLGPGAAGVEIRTLSGVRHTQVIGSQESGLMVEESGSARSLDWKDIDPRSLLGLHRVLVNETDKGPERAKLLVNALAFGWLNGLTEECRMMAEELVKLRPDFSVQWEQILEDFGR